MAYYRILREVLRMTPKEFEESRRRQIAVFKLRYMIASSIVIPETELRIEYSRAKKGDVRNFEKDRDAFLNSLHQEKTSMVFNDWFRTLNQTTKIKVLLNEAAGQGYTKRRKKHT